MDADVDECETAEFYKTYGTLYGYNGTIDAIREKEFKRLGDQLYLDHVGATQYPQSLLDSYMNDISTNIYGNPHSHNPSSQLTTERINEVRNKILHHFNTNSDEYSVIFTSGTTASIKLVAEYFNWQENSTLCFMQSVHTSVVGIREYAFKSNVNFLCISDEDLKSKGLKPWIHDNQTKEQDCCTQPGSSLFVFPAMCNFSGKKYPLELIADIHDLDRPNHWFVMLDAASYVSTSHLDLSKYKPDFIPVSFYKMFGFPTGLGALIIRNKSADVLKKTYYGGGTVLATITSERFHVLRSDISDRFEDGTLPFLDIIAVGHALDNLHHLTGGMEIICQHTFSLTQFVYRKMSEMRHFNGAKVCRLYSGTSFTNAAEQGPVINFNLMRSDGTMIGYGEVDKFACLFNIHLRTGSFCNTGASQQYLGLTNTQLKNNYLAGHVCGDNVDLIDGQPTGSVRISFGYMSTLQEAQKFLKFIRHCFIESSSDVTQITTVHGNQSISIPGVDECDEKPSMDERSEIASEVALSGQAVESKDMNHFKLKKLCLYPVKSCGAFEASSWQIGPRGFMYDRQWMIINDSHICLSQKREPKLCLIQPSIDEHNRLLKIDAIGMPTLDVKILDSQTSRDTNMCKAKVNMECMEVLDCGEEASNWLTSFLGKKCYLVQQKSDDSRKSKVLQPGCKESSSGQSALSLANVSQYLLLSEASVAKLYQHMKQSSEQENQKEDFEKLVSRFRGNIIIDGDEPFQEDEWKTVMIGQHLFQFQGLCARCQMICLDQNTGQRSAEPLKSLGLVRGTKSGTFGIGLVHNENGCCREWSTDKQYLHVGDTVQVVK